MFKKRNAKIVPFSSSSEVQEEEVAVREREPLSETMRVMSLETLFKLHGGQRHPRVESYEVLQEKSCLTELRYTPLRVVNEITNLVTRSFLVIVESHVKFF